MINFDSSPTVNLFKNIAGYVRIYTGLANNYSSLDDDGNEIYTRENLEAYDLPDSIKDIIVDEYSKSARYISENLSSVAYSYTEDHTKLMRFFNDVNTIVRVMIKVKMLVTDVYSMPIDRVQDYLISFGFNHYHYISESYQREVLNIIANFYIKKGTEDIVRQVFLILGVGTGGQNELQIVEYSVNYDTDSQALTLVGTDSKTGEIVSQEDAMAFFNTDKYWALTEAEIKNNVLSVDGEPSITYSAAKTPYYSINTVKPLTNIRSMFSLMNNLFRQEFDDITLGVPNGGSDPNSIRFIQSLGYMNMTGSLDGLTMSEIFWSILKLTYMITGTYDFKDYTNLVQNGTFESGATNWTLYSDTTVDATTYYLGTKSIKIEPVQASVSCGLISDYINIDTSYAYKVKFRHLSETILQGQYLAITIKQYDNSNTLLKSGYYCVDGSEVEEINSTTWDLGFLEINGIDENPDPSPVSEDYHHTSFPYGIKAKFYDTTVTKIKIDIRVTQSHTDDGTPIATTGSKVYIDQVEMYTEAVDLFRFIPKHYQTEFNCNDGTSTCNLLFYSFNIDPTVSIKVEMIKNTSVYKEEIQPACLPEDTNKSYKFPHQNLDNTLGEFIVTTWDELTTYAETTDYVVDYVNGEISKAIGSTIPQDQLLKVTYHWLPQESDRTWAELTTNDPTEKIITIHLGVDGSNNIVATANHVMISLLRSQSDTTDEGVSKYLIATKPLYQPNMDGIVQELATTELASLEDVQSIIFDNSDNRIIPEQFESIMMWKLLLNELTEEQSNPLDRADLYAVNIRQRLLTLYMDFLLTTNTSRGFDYDHIETWVRSDLKLALEALETNYTQDPTLYLSEIYYAMNVFLTDIDYYFWSYCGLTSNSAIRFSAPSISLYRISQFSTQPQAITDLLNFVSPFYTRFRTINEKMIINEHLPNCWSVTDKSRIVYYRTDYERSRDINGNPIVNPDHFGGLDSWSFRDWVYDNGPVQRDRVVIPSTNDVYSDYKHNLGFDLTDLDSDYNIFDDELANNQLAIMEDSCLVSTIMSGSPSQKEELIGISDGLETEYNYRLLVFGCSIDPNTLLIKHNNTIIGQDDGSGNITDFGGGNVTIHVDSNVNYDSGWIYIKYNIVPVDDIRISGNYYLDENVVSVTTNNL